MGVDRNMKKVLVRGPALSSSGYGEHTRCVLRSLKSRPDLFDIYLINVPWGLTSWIWEENEEREWIDSIIGKTSNYAQSGGKYDVSLQVTIPGEWEKLAPYNIGVTAGTESTKISTQWLERCMLVDKIIVVSEHAKFAFENTEYSAVNNHTGESFTAKVTCPIDVVGYPVKNIDKEEIDLDLKYDFNFLTVGTWIPRKNLENTIKWFVEEFYDQEVGLIVKTSSAKNCLADRMLCEKRMREMISEYDKDGERKCQVLLLHGDLSEEEMTGLYSHQKVKCLVNLAHGEGFGLPMFEAAYNGLPVIAPSWGGQCDFLYMPVKDKKGKTKKTAMFTPVSYDVKSVQPEAIWEPVIIKDSQWCFPKEWDYKRALKTMKKNHKQCVSKAKKLKKYIEKNFTEEQIQNKLCEAVYSSQVSVEDNVVVL
jgi:glycosyltransferase involved in cell wall biosynthesis